jgi:hypothetical protein
MMQPKVQIPFHVAGGIFALCAVDAVVAWATNGKEDIRTTWKDTTTIEKLSIRVVTTTSLLGLALYFGAAGTAGGETAEGWRYFWWQDVASTNPRLRANFPTPGVTHRHLNLYLFDTFKRRCDIFVIFGWVAGYFR